MTPAVVDFTSQSAKLRPETMRAVVEAMPEIDRLVVVAFVVVELMTLRAVMVEEALEISPAVNWIKVEVELPSAVGVKGKDPPLAVIAPHATAPEELVVSAFEPEQAEIAEMLKLVVDAVPETVIPVVEAKGKTEAVVEVAVKEGAVWRPEKNAPVMTPAPLIERAVPGEVVPTPRLPTMYWLPVVVAPPEMVSPPA